MMKKIEEIIQISKGKKPKLISKVLEKGLMPYVDIKAFEQKIIDNYTDGEKCLPCEDGDLLIVCDGSRSGLVGRAVKGYVGSTLARIDIDKSVLPEYIYHFNQGKYIQLNTSIKGTGTPHLNQELLKSFELYVPPLEDQHRIVSRIEELFSQLDSGVETLKKTKEQLKVYRQAVLKEAFDECDSRVDVDSVCCHITDGDHMPPPKSPEGIPFIMISNIYGNKINWENTAFVNEDYYNNIDYKRKPQKGDVLYTVTGSFGIPVLVEFDKQFCFQRHIALLRPSEKIDQKFLYYVMQAPEVYSQASKGSTGTAQKTVGLGVLRKILIPYTDSIEIQNRIVTEIESRLSVCDSIEKTIDTALQEAEALRQSILKQAFEGGL